MQFHATRQYRFVAEHFLPQVRGATHPCSKAHPHEYTIRVRLSARDVDADGFVRDDCALIERAIERLEGAKLCELIDPEMTTPECLAAILFACFRKFYPEVCKVTVSASADHWIAFDGSMPPNWARQQATALLAHFQLDAVGNRNAIVMP